MTERALSPAERRRSLSAVIISSFGIGLHFGIIVPLVTLILEGRGVGPAMIGLNAAMQPLALMVLSPFIARIAGALGTLPSLLGGLAVSVAAVLAMALWPDLAAWFLLRFLLGVGMALPWLVGETWINTVAEDESRGRVVALYAIAFFGGLAAGPLLLPLVGTEGWLPFIAAGAPIAAAALPFIVFARLAPAMPPAPRLRLADVARMAPLAMGAAVIAGFSEVGTYALMPLYGLHSGLTQEASVTTLTVFTLGALAVQWPLGAAVDRFGARRLLLACAPLGIACCALVPFVVTSTPLLWAVLFFWGGLSLAFYTLGLALLGQRFERADLAVANVLFIVSFEAGNVTGPILAGSAMALWDPHGFLLALGLALALFCLLGLWYRPRRAPE